MITFQKYQTEIPGYYVAYDGDVVGVIMPEAKSRIWAFYPDDGTLYDDSMLFTIAFAIRSIEKGLEPQGDEE